tara:strand:- start:10566 stop:12476 length:1911 start_codon:yes stop_codon:yes gene_type:complete
MATTITSTELDFQDIKSNLKVFFKQDAAFTDYNFEGSGLNSLLDVLSYNTHFSGLIANFALNESYLGTAQLRNSVVSLAETLGYIPGTRNSSQATVGLTINPGGGYPFDQVYSFQPGELVLRGSIDGDIYTFSNRKTITADAQGTNVYTFYPFDDADASIVVYEGSEKNQQYLVDGSENALYVIPDQNIDASTAIIKVYTDPGVAATGIGAYTVYNDIFDVSSITDQSTLYVLRESPNEFYELTFGAFNSLGVSPVAGNVVDVNYLRASGQIANGISTFRLISTLKLGEYVVNPDEVTITTLTTSAGGTEKEDIESIRKKAPFQYSAQNRMVTPLDYEALILRKYGNFITDIICWGGEDNLPPEYGTTFTSIVWKDNLSSTSISELRRAISDLTGELSVVSFDIKFTAPSETYVSTKLYYQYNPLLGASSQSVVDASVQKTVTNYFAVNIGKFAQVFRRSNLLTEVDDTDPSVLSSRADVTLQKRIIPVLTLPENQKFTFGSALKNPDELTTPVVRSGFFKYQNIDVYIRNKLLDKVKVSGEGVVPIVFDRKPSNKLELVNTKGVVVVEYMGYYEPLTGEVEILNLNVQNTNNQSNYIKVFGVPANESAITPRFSGILKYDASESSVNAVTVTSRV